MNTYHSARSRRTDAQSSAWTFLIVGGAGFLLTTLALAGIIRLPFNTFSLAVMEILFLIFLVIAVISFRQAKKLLDDISQEDSLETRIREWAEENLSADKLLTGIDEDTEEVKYLTVSGRIKEQLLYAFPELGDAHAEQLAEDFCSKLFS